MKDSSNNVSKTFATSPNRAQSKGRPKMSKITTLWLVLVLSLFIACDNTRKVGVYQEMPDSTLAVLDWVNRCDSSYWNALNRTQDNFDRCMTSSDTTACYMNRTEEEYGNSDAHVYCMKNLPMVDYSCVEQLDPNSMEHDADGDGIADYWEYYMGLNPCEKCSYGGIPGLDCDGDLDWDRDGVPNGLDTQPICGQMYDNGWHETPTGINGGTCA